nr:N-acetyltransferase [uncultured Capnocytophaga sp.]
MEVIDSEFSRQYQAKINGELAFVEYAIQERKIFFTKTLLPEGIKEELSDEFFKGVLALVAQKKYRVVPVCPTAIAFFKRNKEYKDILPAGIRI